MAERGSCKLSLFCLRGSRTNCTLVRAKGKDHFFADNFGAAEIILLAKMGKQKIASRNFFGALFAPIFSRPLLWTEKAVNFLNREGQKRGATHSPRQERFPLYVAQRCQRCKNVTLCQRVTETPAKFRLWIMIFTSVLNRQYRRRVAIALRHSPFFGLPCAFLKLVNGLIY
jgi:hypothetical protein